jgi:hypothetical protein
MLSGKVVYSDSALPDVQALAEDSSLAGTKRYIDGDAEAKRKVVELV